MKIKNKKGQELDFIADIVLSIIMLTGSFFLVRGLILTADASDKIIMEETLVQLNHDEYLVQLLNSEYNGNKISDIIVASYMNKDKNFLKRNIEGFLNTIYQKEVCYHIEINKFEINKKCKEKEDHPLLDSSIIIPVISNPKFDTLLLNMKIEGYS